MAPNLKGTISAKTGCWFFSDLVMNSVIPLGFQLCGSIRVHSNKKRKNYKSALSPQRIAATIPILLFFPLPHLNDGNTVYCRTGSSLKWKSFSLLPSFLLFTSLSIHFHLQPSVIIKFACSIELLIIKVEGRE